MLRIAQWALINKPMLAATLVQKLAELAWGSGLDPENESELHRIFLQSGFDEMDWVHLHSRDSRKQIQLQLRENQQAAIASECFGVPSWIFNGELFWGADAFVDLKYVIQGEDFLDHDQYRRYCDLVVNQAIETNPMQVQP
jgi:2-hydroxychromene-2-carboxylate isomerase